MMIKTVKDEDSIYFMKKDIFTAAILRTMAFAQAAEATLWSRRLRQQLRSRRRIPSLKKKDVKN